MDLHGQQLHGGGLRRGGTVQRPLYPDVRSEGGRTLDEHTASLGLLHLSEDLQADGRTRPDTPRPLGVSARNLEAEQNIHPGGEASGTRGAGRGLHLPRGRGAGQTLGPRRSLRYGEEQGDDERSRHGASDYFRPLSSWAGRPSRGALRAPRYSARGDLVGWTTRDWEDFLGVGALPDEGYLSGQGENYGWARPMVGRLYSTARRGDRRRSAQLDDVQQHPGDRQQVSVQREDPEWVRAVQLAHHRDYVGFRSAGLSGAGRASGAAVQTHHLRGTDSEERAAEVLPDRRGRDGDANDRPGSVGPWVRLGEQ